MACFFLLLFLHLGLAVGWQDWTETKRSQKTPGVRRGHSLVIRNDRYVVLFGGRQDDVSMLHQPTTFDLREVEGVVEFLSYDGKIVNKVITGGSLFADLSKGDVAANQTVGTYLNDVWSYDLCCNASPEDLADKKFVAPGVDRDVGVCARGLKNFNINPFVNDYSGRSKDEQCTDKPGYNNPFWTLQVENQPFGGCQMALGSEVCTAPSERWYHSAAMFDADQSMLIFGGFSQYCVDYCDDMWQFDFDDTTWVQIFGIGELIDGPGKLWRHATVSWGMSMYLFGGHRLWHGFSEDNRKENSWRDYGQYPRGGYLDDLWVLNKTTLQWSTFPKLEICFPSAGRAWSQRNDIACQTNWPKGRASHSLVIDISGTALWLFGGFTSYFPYISTGGAGYGYGVSEGGAGTGFVPFPSLPFYLDDLWNFDLGTGRWSLMKPVSEFKPAERIDHSMIIAGNILIMFGGYRSGFYYGDTWHYNITSNTWLEKTSFVHPNYPVACTDDLEPLINPDTNEFLTIKTLTDFDWLANEATQEQLDFLENCPVVPWTLYDPMGLGASGPNQFRNTKTVEVNDTYSFIVRKECTSVWGEPTRGTLLDGLEGRSSERVLIPQPRRRRPGWDGCRDRIDQNSLFPNGLTWLKPRQRSGHRAVYSNKLGMMLMYGGRGYMDETPIDTSNNITNQGIIMPEPVYFSDFWQYKTHPYNLSFPENCPSACSGKGNCTYGNCICWDGYYGVDCSNKSCPGDFCYYDPDTQIQHCSHCCHAGADHEDGQLYQEDGARKVTCSLKQRYDGSDYIHGESHGVCDGFGHCQCAPPFITADCSIKDCPNNCTHRGWCSVEYPISRCMCDPGYRGHACEIVECLNNCTYPNGVCNYTSGVCNCAMLMSPYNRSREYRPWMGEDCSYLPLYAAASYAGVSPFLMLLSCLVGGLLLNDKFYNYK